MEPFTEAELGLIASLTREKIRKVARNRRTNQAKWGDEYDPTQHDRKLAVLEMIYRKTGKDPANITNVKGETTVESENGGTMDS